MSGSSGVIQYYTNNDGNLGGGYNMGFAVPPQLLEKLEKNMSGIQTKPVVPSDGDTDMANPPGTLPTDPNGDPTVEQHVFLSRSGNYYKSGFRKHPSDALIPFPSPEIEAHFATDAAGNAIDTNADVVRDSMFAEAAAAGIIYDPLLTYKQRELIVQDQLHKQAEQELLDQQVSQQTSLESQVGEDDSQQSSSKSTIEEEQNSSTTTTDTETEGSGISSTSQDDSTSTTDKSTTEGDGTTTTKSSGF